MKIRQGYIVKIADIGTPGKVLKVSDSGREAVIVFNFPEGEVEGTLPVSIISNILSRGKPYVQA